MSEHRTFMRRGRGGSHCKKGKRKGSTKALYVPAAEKPRTGSSLQSPMDKAERPVTVRNMFAAEKKCSEREAWK